MATSPGRPADGVPQRSLPGDRMTDVEAVMWHVEQDPFLSSVFGSVTVFDRLPDLDRLVGRLARMAAVIPRLHQRVVSGPAWLAPPVWLVDPDFDLRYHLRRAAVPAPGDRAALYELACNFIQDPLDRRRPLWQYLIVEGVDGQGAALVQKMNHAVTDGVGGVRLAEQFIDLTADAEDPPGVDLPAPATGDGAALWAGAAHTLAQAADAGRAFVEGIAGDLRHPSRALARPAAVLDAAGSMSRQVVISDRSRSPLWTRRTLRRSMLAFDADFDDAHRAAKALGGSLNDLFVTATAGAAGAYHRHFGVDVDALRMAMPVSTRTDRSAGGNAFVPTRVLVPTGDVDPADRFAEVHDALARVRREPAIGLAGAFASIARLLPTPVLAQATRRQVEAIDFACSNVRAAPVDLFVAGARIEANYALGPLAGSAFNLTMMSYCGALNMGLHVDGGAVAEPALLERCLRESFAEVIAAG
jgi:diacylglycerol O-acyltransferase